MNVSHHFISYFSLIATTTTFRAAMKRAAYIKFASLGHPWKLMSLLNATQAFSIFLITSLFKYVELSSERVCTIAVRTDSHISSLVQRSVFSLR